MVEPTKAPFLTRFIIEGLCLLMLLQGYPAMAIEPVDPRAPALETREVGRGLWGQPWGDALAIFLATGATQDGPGRVDEVGPPEGPVGMDVGQSPFRPPTEQILAMAPEPTADPDHGTLHLIPGWNLLSLPSEYPSSDPQAVLQAFEGFYTRVYTYDACDVADPWKVFDPNDPAASDLTVLDRTQGFWIENTGSIDITAEGDLAATTTFDLCVGWNLIGFPAGQARHVTNALHSIEGKYLRVFGYDAADPEDPWEVYSVGVPTWANDLSLMHPGRGYWVLVTEATTLEIANQDGPPDVDLASPETLALATAPTAIVGSITSKILDGWSLRYRRVGDGGWTEFASGVAPVQDQVLGTFDPTTLLNGLYEVELRATDVDHRIVSTSIDLVVDGTLKVGHFTLPLLDLAVPVVGIPLEVIRTYDSHDKEVRDFGVGWRLGLSAFEVRENRAPGVGWRGTVSEGLFPTYCIEPEEGHVVTVTFPDGDVARFQPRIEPQCQTLAPQQVVSVTYEPLRGTYARLEPVDLRFDDLLVVGAFPGPIELWGQDVTNIHNPSTYRMTAADGTEYVVDEEDGLRSITDTNGNVLTVSETGISHSRGVGLTFVRDGAGRIEQIIDPLSNTIDYRYDHRGDLVEVTDREGNTVVFTYVDDHFLDKIIVDGVVHTAYEYDGDDRWTGTCDTNDQCTRIDHQFDGNREIVTDATGRKLTYVYDDFGNVTEIIDGLGNTTVLEYGDFGRVDSITSAEGEVTRFFYDPEGRLERQVDPHPAGEPAADYTTEYSYTPKGLLERVDFPSGAADIYDYDDDGNLLAQRDESGQLQVGYTYGPGGVATSISDPFGTITLADHNAQGLPRTQIDPEGVVTTTTYDANGNLRTLSAPNVQMTMTYDAEGRPRRTEFDDGQLWDETSYGLGSFWTSVEGPSFGRQERLVTSTGKMRGWKMPDGGQHLFDRDPVGRMTGMRSPKGFGEVWTYDAAGRLETRTDSMGATRTYGRDKQGRILRETDPYEHVTSRTYDAAGRLATITNARNETWRMSYDGQNTTITDPLDRETTIHLSNRGLPIGRTYPGTASGNPGRATESREYLLGSALDGAESYPTQTTDAGGKSRTWTYDDRGFLRASQDLAEQTYTFEYQPITGHLVSMRSPTGLTRGLTYDPTTGKVETVTTAEGKVVQSEYGPDARLEKRTLASGTTVDFDFDPMGRLTAYDASTGESLALVWNTDDTLDSITDGTGSTQYHYDDLSRLTGIDTPDQAHVVYTRDLLGRIETVSVQAAPGEPARVTAYTYDPVGNLETVVDPFGQTTVMAYDAVNRLERRELPNGVVSHYRYNAFDQIIEVTHVDASGQVLASRHYTRGGVGEPSRITREDGSYVDLTYDAGRRLETETHFDADGSLLTAKTYGYDLAGNRESVTVDGVTETYTYGIGHWVTGVSGPGGNETYGYDDDGRVTSIDRDGVSLGLVYDSMDNLLRVTRGGDTVASETVARYAYDAQERRTRTGDGTRDRRVVVAPVAHGSLEHTQAISDDSGTLLAGFVYAGDQPLMRYGADGPVYYLTDAMGTVIGLADGAGGSVASFHYDGFGNLQDSAGPMADLDPALGGDFRFQGQWQEESTGLIHMRARYYDPQLGRFLSRDDVDPMAYRPETFNDYAFAFSNPHLYRDPSGFFSMVEMNITMSTQEILTAIKSASLNYARQTAKEEISEAIADLLTDLLSSVMPLFSPSLLTFVDAAGTKQKEGDVFAGIAQSAMCDLARDYFPSIFDHIYLEVGVDDDGEAQDDGLFDCSGSSRGPRARDIFGNELPNPDFVFSAFPPTQGRTFLIGDFKRSITSAVSTGGRRQFDAIVLHASRHGMRLALYLTIYGLPSNITNVGLTQRWADAQRFAAGNGVKVFIGSFR